MKPAIAFLILITLLASAVFVSFAENDTEAIALDFDDIVFSDSGIWEGWEWIPLDSVGDLAFVIPDAHSPGWSCIINSWDKAIFFGEPIYQMTNDEEQAYLYAEVKYGDLPGEGIGEIIKQAEAGGISGTVSQVTLNGMENCLLLQHSDTFVSLYIPIPEMENQYYLSVSFEAYGDNAATNVEERLFPILRSIMPYQTHLQLMDTET